MDYGGTIFTLGELLALPVAIFTTIQLGIDNWENKILIWWPQLSKELTGGDGYKFKPNAVQWIFFPTRSICIIVRGSFRVGVGVDVNKTQSNR